MTHSFLLSLDEASNAAVRPYSAFEIRGAITPTLQAEFEQRIVARLRALNSDYREAIEEFAGAAMPVIRLYAIGTVPFAAEGSRIKQTRLVNLAPAS